MTGRRQTWRVVAASGAAAGIATPVAVVLWVRGLEPAAAVAQIMGCSP